MTNAERLTVAEMFQASSVVDGGHTGLSTNSILNSTFPFCKKNQANQGPLIGQTLFFYVPPSKSLVNYKGKQYSILENNSTIWLCLLFFNFLISGRQGGTSNNDNRCFFSLPSQKKKKKKKEEEWLHGCCWSICHHTQLKTSTWVQETNLGKEDLPERQRELIRFFSKL